MNHKNALVLLFLVASNLLNAQGTIEQALTSIAKSNKTLIAANQYVTAKKLELHTGITPENPFVSADYMIGKPVAGGNQFDFLFTQAFDFPSVYFKKSDLAGQKEEMLAINLEELRQTILLESKTTILVLIHLNKQRLAMQARVENSTLLVDNYQQRFIAEEISALELNKAKIQLLNFQTQLRTIKNEIKIKTQHLTELNGGNEITINDTEFPMLQLIPAFEVLEAAIEVNDPQLKTLHQQTEVYQTTLKLNRALALPKFELGYHYQSVLGQTFYGAHFGISIPLWESKNTIKAANANIQLGNVQVEEHKMQHYFEIKELYGKYQNLEQTIGEYNAILSGLNSEEILQQSLELGEINFITYSAEIQYYYNAQDALLELEKEYQIAVATLFKYQL